jgi:glycerol-3-phosphate cytidylyltransferase
MNFNSSDERVGITASCFDLFHAGHVLMLQEAKEQCDRLVVALQTDPTIDRPEKNKPVQSLVERYIQVQACRYVDDIIPYTTEEDLLNILQCYDWDVRIIGQDYYGKRFTGDELDMEVYYNSRRHSFSTTELRKRISNGNKITAEEV